MELTPPNHPFFQNFLFWKPTADMDKTLKSSWLTTCNNVYKKNLIYYPPPPPPIYVLLGPYRTIYWDDFPTTKSEWDLDQPTHPLPKLPSIFGVGN